MERTADGAEMPCGNSCADIGRDDRTQRGVNPARFEESDWPVCTAEATDIPNRLAAALTVSPSSNADATRNRRSTVSGATIIPPHHLVTNVNHETTLPGVHDPIPSAADTL